MTKAPHGMYQDRLKLAPGERIVIHKGPLGNGMWYDGSLANTWVMFFENAKHFESMSDVIKVLLMLGDERRSEVHTNPGNKITLYVVAQQGWSIVGRFGKVENSS